MSADSFPSTTDHEKSRGDDSEVDENNKTPWSREQIMTAIMILLALLQGSGLFTVWKDRILDHEEIIRHAKQIEKVQYSIDQLHDIKMEESKTLAVVAEKVDAISKTVERMNERTHK